MNDAILPSLNNNVEAIVQKPVLTQDIEEWVDINQLVRQALQKNANSIAKEQLILRIDPLPFVYGNALQYARIFDSLIAMIVLHPPANSKLFLYIKCEAEVARKKHEHKTNTVYKISFYTNIHTNEDWNKLYRDKLIEYTNTLNKGDIFFSFCDISNTGCLFSINLPGKIS